MKSIRLENQPRPQIKVLSEHVANQIAAGEVIERPAAVVKELVENSIDAGASKIEVEYRNGGKVYLRIEDDGCGMYPEEAELAFQRHATSKLREAEDLIRIATMGFRGEALPSIASVAKFTLRTRPADCAAGWEVVFSQGKHVHSKQCGMPFGTRIEITDLFESVPARRKFLKSDRTEAQHIFNLCRLYAIAHPEIAMRVIEDGRVVLRSPRCRRAVDRVAEIWNRRLAAELLELPLVETDGYRLHGLVSKSGYGRASKHAIITVVNGRPVESITLSRAVRAAYEQRIPKHQYPAVFLFLQLPAAAVDVNVHPTKREIRFRDELAVSTLVQNAIVERLTMTSSQEPRLSPLPPDLLPMPSVVPQASSVAESLPRGEPSRRTLSDEERGLLRVADPATPPQPIVTPASQESAREGVLTQWKFKARLKHNLAVFETEQGVFLFNWRAAHERIVYEQILNQLENADEPSAQGLLLPVVVELDPLDADAVGDHLDVLQRQGFGVELFGRNTYRIEAVPSWLEREEVADYVNDFAALLRELGRSTTQMRERVARLAASRALRGSDQPGEEEIVHLRQEVQRCREPLICPRGRPLWVAYHWSELLRKFQLR